ncbi:hypothetical protein Bravens_00050 [Brevibacterium ravenspurgense]|uniref:Copper chaperone PCu(A)C n=1 Tax=Brevibacterium ravenspurgense TaxID=479117 RepID=A0A150HCU7_9MICO|nr:copper chaperone PCu(A)C [Brevibacterium ravenspurgense]KXZ59835.1 hypothetical protein Bravens_00050 [Brevibacterium ravenspurgense]
MKLRKTLMAALAAATLTLAGCGGGDTATSAADALKIDEPWAKAVPQDKGMTGVFATIENEGKETITITGAESDVAGKVELHETTGDGKGGMSMKEKEGGFELAAGDTLELKPGGDHIMLMDLKQDIEPGEEIKITVKTSAGDFDLTAPAREFTGAKEEYAPDEHDHGEHMDHGDDEGDEGHDHSDDDHEDSK